MITTNIINKILQTAIKYGGDFAEVFVEDKFNTNISVSNSNVEKGIVANDYGIGIRVFFGKTFAYTYTNNDSEENLIKITRELCSIYKKNGTTFVKPVLEPLSYIKEAKKYFSKTSYNQKIDVINQVISSGKSYDKAIDRMLVRYLDEEQNVLIANTDGVFVQDKRNKTRLLISAYANKNGVVQNGYIGPGAMMGFEFYDTIDLDYFGREAARSACDMVDADYCEAGQMSVVVDNGFGGLLFHEACGHSLEASSVAKGNSEFSGKLGQKVASDIVTLVDDGSIENAWGSLNVDDEGTKTKKNILIKNGILNGYMIDKLNSRIMNMDETGSGRRESYKYAPTSRMTNTYIEAGKSTRDEIIQNTERGLFVKNINAGSVNPVTGEFNFSVAESYMIENGKLTKPVKGATLIGTGGSILKLVDMVGDNLSIGQGYCYSASGAIYIGAGQPTVRISNMTVGGMK
ncbi:TldD/PmbA family protein [Sedimentibacter sp. zth1]|uniref:TldD/PmbA family protein n=1 Tax=Sedimentibacter sp. zth1 TaxID=2816908 RepID=UPI001A9199C3|nr:TldD/PmbA family protein [Sedimentibacter sp. zth1]QSX06168.1 TldD/PmbA family protein [Sedimentibacter sp. zth1]